MTTETTCAHCRHCSTENPYGILYCDILECSVYPLETCADYEDQEEDEQG